MSTVKGASAQTSLHIGDTVLFFVRSKERNGYIYYELSSAPYNFLSVFPVKTEKEPNFPNVAFATFKVLAPNKYKAKQHLNALEQKSKKIEEYELSNAKRAVEAEDLENEQEQIKRLGTKVLYGDLLQIQHTGSKKYVTVCSEASKTENNNLLVNLNDENSDDAIIFKILPRYKVRSEGDEVRFGDQLKLESVKTQGQYLHVSGRSQGGAGYNVLPDNIELNLSATESALTLMYHYSPSVQQPNKALRNGSCVRLFHNEDECYIVAEGSFASTNRIVEDGLHCRQRRVDSRKHSEPSTSANTYWQIEKEDDPRTGEILSWGERFRIKHLPTRMYLCVTVDLQVTLKERAFNDSDFYTLFSFYPLIEEGDEVLLESYARIKHLLSGQWLHLEKKEHYVRKNFNPEAEGLAGLQWDSAELYELMTSKERGDYDSFTLQEVSEDLLDRFNYVAGIVPVLSDHITHIQEGVGMVGLSQKQSIRVRDTLMELRRWLVTDDERDTKNQQKHLRNLRVIEQLAEILKSGNLPEVKQSQADICRECYNVFKRYLEGDSRKNENYLARFIEFFQTQMRKGLNAEEVLVEIVQDNVAIVSKMAATRMGHMIDQFCTTLDSRYLDFLSSLCVCSGRPIPPTQNRLLYELVLDKGKDIFLRTKVIGSEEGEERVLCHQPGSDKVTSLRKMKPSHDRRMTRSRKGPSQTRNEFELLQAQLHLFARLCKGNNKLAIEALLYSPENPNGYIDFKQALLCASDDSLDTSLRSRYVELILVMFVDVGENRPFLDNLCYSFIYSDLVAKPYADTGDDETVALTGVENTNFPELKLWVLDAIKNNVQLHCDSNLTNKNELLEQIIDVLGHLVRYGYYDDEDDVDKVMGPLIKLLDGTSDLPSAGRTDCVEEMEIFITSERKEDLVENKPVFAVKNKALEVLELFFRFKFYVKLQKFMNDFKVLHGEGRKPYKTTDGAPPLILKDLMTNTGSNYEWLYEDNIIKAVLDRLSFLCDGEAKGCGFAPKDDLIPNLEQGGFAPKDDSIPNLEQVLLDLSCYDDEELVGGSLHLLTQMYYFEDELFNKAQQAQILTSPASIEQYNKVNDEILPELRQLLRVDTSQKNQDRMIELLQTLSGLCILVLETGAVEPNKQNQHMLDNFGLVSEILSYTLSKGLEHQQSTGTEQDTDTSVTVREEVFRECFCFLRYLAADNESVQKRLFNRINDLLEVKVPGAALADVADLLTEVFTGGPELILKVTEAHVERIFEIIINSDNPTVKAQFMVTLQAMAKIEELDLPVGLNQALIVKNFCRLRDTFCPEMLAEGKDTETKRMRILTEPEDTSDLKVLLSVTDLLAACAESKNLFIESVCQNIFSIEELVEIIRNNLPPVRKRPFVRFLIWVYMSAEGDQQSNQDNALAHGSAIWKYLHHISSLMENVANALSLVPKDERETIRHELTAASRRRNSYSAHSPQYTGSRLSRILSVGIPDVTDEEGQLVPGLLEYLADGVIPFLHAFYSSFFDPDDAQNEDDRDMEYNVSAQITKNLMHLGSELVNFFSNPIHISLYNDTLNKLIAHTEIKIRADVNESTPLIVKQPSTERPPPGKRSTLTRVAALDSPTTGEPMSGDMLENYKGQQKLNDDFKQFARNYQIAYRGPNTAQFQINSPVAEIEYSDDGEELPLGPSFQNLVKIYLNDDGEDGQRLQHLVTIHRTDHEDSKIKKEAERLLRQLEISNSRTEQLSDSDQIKQDVVDVRCLQILRALIHNQIKLIDPELKDRDPIQFRKRSDQFVVPVQIHIQNFDNAIKRIVPLLAHPNEDISRDALALMKALLFSGNEEVQGGLANSLKETREEILFLHLKQRIEIASHNYKESVDLEKQLSSRQEVQLRLKSPLTDSESPHATAAKAFGSTDQLEVRKGKEVAISMEVFKSEDSGLEDNLPLLNAQNSLPHLKQAKGTSFDSDGESHGGTNEEEDTLLSQIMASDTSWTSLVLEVIGLMCDGQHRTLQHYLRDQPDNFKTINVVAEVANFLHTYTSELSHETLEHVTPILQALIEMSVGNFKNQQVIFDKLVIDPINRILQLQLGNIHENCNFDGPEGKCPECKYLLNMIEVKGSAVELVGIMLEETNPETPNVALGIGSSIDEDSVIETMGFFHELQSHPIVRQEQMDDDCERGMYRAYHILIALMDYEASSVKDMESLKKKAQKNKEALNDCIEHTRSIEIHFQEEGCKPLLSKVHFPFDDPNTLREEITEQVCWNVNRDSMEDKQRSLVDLMPALKSDIKHQARLKDIRILRPLLAYHTFRSRLLIFLTVLLNLFVLFAYEVPDSAQDNNRVFLPQADVWFRRYLLFIVGVIHLIMSFWIVVEYFLINWPHFKLPQFFYTYWVKITHFITRDRSPFKQLPQFTFLDVNVFGVTTLYMIIFLACSILSLVFRGYFYCICLLFIIVNNDILQRVLRAVTKNGTSLIWVAILGLIVLFIYAVLSFATLHNKFISDNDDGALYCETLTQCMYSVLRYGLIDNLGLVVPLSSDGEAPGYSSNLQPVRLIFDLSFFIIVTTIGLNIVFGIIVDTFSELREERSNIEDEQKSKCFICDLASYDFERKAKGFRNHVKYDHNMWDYVYYSFYLDSIDTGDHNAIQKYVYEQIAGNDTGFFPQEEARCFEGEEDATGQKLDELYDQVKGILQRFKEKEHAKSLNAKRDEQMKFEQVLKTRTSRGHVGSLSGSLPLREDSTEAP